MKNISKNTLYKLYIEQKLSDQKISDKLKIKRRDVTRLRKIYNINSIENYERVNTNKLNERLKSILVGSILGDGHIRRRGKEKSHSQLMIEQSKKHEEYFLWTKDEFIDWIYNKNKKNKINKKHNKDTKTFNYSLSFQTICHPEFDEFHSSFYENSKKRIDFDVLKKYFNELSLAVWIMDDGGLTGRNKRTRLCTNGFKREEVVNLQTFLQEKYNLKSWIITSKTKTSIGHELHFDKVSSLKITKLVEDFVVPSMQYKLLRPDMNDIKIVKNNEINLTKEEWDILNKLMNKNDIKNVIVSFVKNLSFPYKKITKKDAIDDFINLIDLNVTSSDGSFKSRYDYRYKFLNSYVGLNKCGSLSSNYFQQINRMECDSINSPSPIRVWNNEKFLKTKLNYLWSINKGEINNDTILKSMQLRGHISSQFKPSVAKYVYNKYGNKGSVLDFSAGWGDRLAGFYASNCKHYVGIDPNKSVTDTYAKQIKLYESLIMGKKSVDIINCPAEDVSLKDKFDLIFTSPPYFDLERYSQDETQSWKRYKTLHDWLSCFLFKTIENFWRNLKRGGHLIINISDVYCHHKIQNICDPMNDFISKLDGSEYIGAIGMKISKRPNSKPKEKAAFCEPLWIWNKK